MRPIKFRAFHKEDKTICDVVRIDLFAKCALVKLKNGRHKDFSFDDIELMQFTGLYDKNSKELFEGDVIKAPNGTRVYQVVFEMGAFRLIGKKQPIKQSSYLIKTMEIIGNIHENPELLEQ